MPTLPSPGQVSKAFEQKAIQVIQSSNSAGIPESPIGNMAAANLGGLTSSFNLLQTAVDSLTKKARAGSPFTDDDKEFMTELFETMWYGGVWKGYFEAAILANHYVNGAGADLFINDSAYVTSQIVQDTMSAMVKYAASTPYSTQDMITIKSSNPKFMASSHGQALQAKNRSVNKDGKLQKGGTLIAEQSNGRLKNADHRFYLQMTLRRNGDFSSIGGALRSASNGWADLSGGATNMWRTSWDGHVVDAAEYLLSGGGTAIKTLGGTHTVNWRVDSIWDFAPFPKNDITHLPVGAGMTLKLPDGLSHYLTKIGVAKEYKYYSEW